MALRKLEALALALCVSFAPAGLAAQAGQPAQQTHIETNQELVAHLTPAQKEQFDAAVKAFTAHRYGDALAGFQALLKDLPGDLLVAKFASDAAIQSGDVSFALGQLKPIAQANPDDWQAISLLTRAYAESGDKANRDAGIARMLELHKRGVTPPSLLQYPVERIQSGDKTLVIRTSLDPWGAYKVYDLAQVFDSQGNMFLRITIESSDFDQPLFAKNHPKEAADGVRQFSLDAYRETGVNDSGQRTQTHSTFRFFVGQPSYDTVREAFLEVASGKITPLSSRSNLVVP